MTDAADSNRLIIFDTTLRDGEQAPGCSMSLKQKLRLAEALADLKVDVIEAGFPAASPGDFESVQTIASRIDGPVICGLARCIPGDIEAATAALAPAKRRRLHVFLATSAIHREHKLGLDRDEVVRRAVEGVTMAAERFDDVEFSPEDASRTEPEFLAEVLDAAIEAGARTVNIPDTVGYTTPDEFYRLFSYLREHVRNIDKAVLSVHCHDDLGLAVANSLAAVRAGARQVECTINGIGERAGNCALEEVVMAVRTRRDVFDVETGIDTRRLHPTSRLVSSIIGVPVPRNKAIVGDNAFAHESGIHQDGMLKHRDTYEIMRPEDVGLSRSNLVLGKHSGRHAFSDRVKQMGFDLDSDEIDRVFDKFKRLADKKREIFDADVEALVLDTETAETGGPWVLEELRIASTTGSASTATIRLKYQDGTVREEAAVGIGPIDAAVKAMQRATDLDVHLQDMTIHSVSVGEDAQGEVTTHVTVGDEKMTGHGVGTDVVEAVARSVLQTVNRVCVRRQRLADKLKKTG